MSDQISATRINLYLVTDIDMHEDFFAPVAAALRSRFEAENKLVAIRTLHPYSSNNDNIIKQLLQARHDFKLYPQEAGQSIGGQSIRQQVKMHGAKDPLVFIGHGAGGVAAYHAAELLEQDGCEIRFIAQIGSAKVPIGASFKDRVGFLTRMGLRREGEPAPWQDGWSHAKYRLTSHRYPGLLFIGKEKGRRFYAPNNVARIEIKGSQTSYYSTTEGLGAVSNLAKTINVIWDWFRL
jgi:hypothetical protein